MREIVFDQTGLPRDVLYIKESERPVPAKGEVLIRVLARTINPSDLMFIQGMYGITPRLPSSAGFEASGVVEIGDEKGVFLPGTRVMFTAAGTWKDFVSVPVQVVIPIPEQLTDELACQAFVNPLTAYGMLETSGLQAGDWLLLTAGASAFGKFTLQLAREKGIRVAATVRHEEQKDILKNLGAELVFNSDHEKFHRLIPELCGGGVHVVFDAVSGQVGAKALACLRHSGKMMAFGALSLEPMPIASGLLIFKNLTIEGFWLSTWLEKLDGKERKKAFEKVFEFLLKDSSQVDIAGIYPLHAFREAIEAYERPGRNGKILLMG